MNIDDFHIVGDWERVCVLWDIGHNTLTARKSTLSFTKSLSLVRFGPILNEIQPFKTFKKFSKKCMDSRTRRTICPASVCFFFFWGLRWAERGDFGPRVFVLDLVFCTRLVRVTFSVVLSNSLNSRSRSLFSGREECLQYASQTCEA